MQLREGDPAHFATMFNQDFGVVAVGLPVQQTAAGSIRILDDEILGAPRLLFQRLVKGNTSGLKLKAAS